MSLLEEAYRKYTQVEIPVTEPGNSRPKQPSEPIVQSVDMVARKQIRKRRSELQNQAADDWSEISADPGKLIAFASLEATRQIRASGSIPDTYTSMTLCAGCKTEVPIFHGCPPRVTACVWCLNGQTPPPIPGVKE